MSFDKTSYMRGFIVAWNMTGMLHALDEMKELHITDDDKMFEILDAGLTRLKHYPPTTEQERQMILEYLQSTY